MLDWLSHHSEGVHSCLLAAHPDCEPVTGRDFVPVTDDRPSIDFASVRKSSEDPVPVRVRLEDPVGHFFSPPMCHPWLLKPLGNCCDLLLPASSAYNHNLDASG